MGRFKLGEQVCNNCIHWKCNDNREFQGNPPREVYTCVNCAECSKTGKDMNAKMTCAFFSHIGGVTVTFPAQSSAAVSESVIGEISPGASFLNATMRFIENSRAIDEASEAEDSHQSESAQQEDENDLNGEAELEFVHAMQSLAKINDNMSEMLKDGYNPDFGWGDTKTFEFFGLWYLAKSGNAKAQYQLAKAFEKGNHGAKQDNKLAREWLEKAADGGFSRAAYELGEREAEGKNWSGKPDLEAALRWFGRAKELGSRAAIEAYKLTKEKAIGNAKSLLVLALKNLSGYECEQDIGHGIVLIRKANKEIHQSITLEGVDKAFTDSFLDALCRIADAEYHRLQNVIGMMFGGYSAYKRLIHQDDRAAVEWFLKSAKGGWTDAMDNLATCYNRGEGVEKDVKEAARWYSLAAEKGLAWGQFHFGEMLASGKGVAKDEKLAASWYEKAAIQGVAKAQHYLGVCYEKGCGVVKDSKLGAAWKARAKANGYESWDW